MDQESAQVNNVVRDKSNSLGTQLFQRGGMAMMFGQARSRSVLMGLDNHMITSTVPALLSESPA